MKDGTRKILAKAVRSLEAAKELLSDGAIDLAAGRGYYAMLYAAKAVLYENGVHLQAHARIVETFERDIVRSGRVPGPHADWIRQALHRRMLDRESEIAPTSADVETLVEQARQIVAQASRTLTEPPAS